MFLPPPYAIDIGDRTIKIAQLTPARWWDRATPGMRFRVLVAADLEAGWVVDGEIRDPASLAAFVRRSIFAHTTRWQRASCAVTTLPENRTFLTTAIITPESGETRDAALRRAIRTAVPIDAAHAVMTSVPIPGDPQRVAITAVPTDVVTAYASLLETVDLTPVACVSEAEALARAIAYETSSTHNQYTRNSSLGTHPSAQPTLILDLGATRTGAIITVPPAVIASLTIPLSGEQLTAAIAAKLKISTVAAEQAKRDVDLTRAGHDNPIATAVAQAYAPLLEHIAKLRAFVGDRFIAALQPTRIVLTGGGAALTGLDAFLHEHTKLPVTQFTIPARGTSDTPHPTNAYATAFGLSCIALDPAAALAASPL